MKNPNLRGLLVFVILAAFFFAGVYTGTKRATEYQVVYDTASVTVERDSLVLRYRDSVRLVDQPNLINETIYDTVTHVVYKRTYSDTVSLDVGLSVLYLAHVTGSLDNISLGYIDSRPEKIRIIETTNTITETRTIDPNGFYLGANLHTLSGVGINGNYLHKRHLGSVSYYPADRSFQIGYAFKLFK